MSKYIPQKTKRFLFERAKRLCEICGVETRLGGLYDSPFRDISRSGCIDHIVPISKGGKDFIFNLRWTCKCCNSGRGNRDFFVPWRTVNAK